MKKLLFIYNPTSGKGLIRLKAFDIIDLFTKNGYDVIAYPTQSYKDAEKKVLEYDGADIDLIVCSGGDGTLDEVVTGMMASEHKKTIGYIPAGSTNDFARSLKIPLNIMKAAEVAINGTPFPCDIGRFNKGIFVYIAAFGLFTDVSYQTDQAAKNVLGHLAYVLEGAKRIFNVPSYKLRVTFEDGVIEDEFVFGMVTNSRSVGGFKGMVGKKIMFDDGVFEVCLIKTPKNPIELQEIIGSLLLASPNSKHMYIFKSGHLEIESEEDIPWTLDGEYGGSHEKVVIKDQNKAVSIMVPERAVYKLSVGEE
ncbi:MAG: YegS/Rv2252/BmrU family lipid kinase [Lachnospiraceae bacterium]|jgi:YegS/Rv2252/BmrU family lipid kinase|nr:YegS/Rv2252/BmrU family lipid kinase [Lachnospiraceae bacterium]